MWDETYVSSLLDIISVGSHKINISPDNFKCRSNSYIVNTLMKCKYVMRKKRFRNCICTTKYQTHSSLHCTFNYF